MIFTYICNVCGQEDLHKIYQDWSDRDDGIWRESIEMPPEKAAKLPEWDDPRFHEKEVEYGKELPEKLKCSKCKKKTSILTFDSADAPNMIAKGNTAVNRQRERDFHQYGMNKQQAENFYKESIEASKERIKSGGVHYKPVDPDINYLRSEGKVTRVKDGDVSKNKEYLKKANVKLTENLKKNLKKK